MAVIITEYFSGETVESQATFAVNGTNTDPTTITVRIKNPLGTITSFVHGTDPEVVKEATGIFHIEQAVNIAGIWVFRWEGTGTAAGVGEDRIKVLKSDIV